MPGMLWEQDYPSLVASLARALASTSPTTLFAAVEIGVNDGRTTRDLIAVIEGVRKQQDFLYFGIDPEPDPKIDCNSYFHLKKMSHKIIESGYGDCSPIVPARLDWVFVDGCHCFQCVIRDGILFGSRLRPGGEICFHDASPKMQLRDNQDYVSMRDGNRNHDEVAARRGIEVRRALDSGFLAGFELVSPAPDQQYGGLEVYRKL